MLFFAACLLLICPNLAAALPLEQIDQKVHSHLILMDYSSASIEAWEGIQSYPDSKALWKGYLTALAKLGDEKRLMSTWNAFILRFPDEQGNREILECLAWAVIEKAACSSSPAIRVFALLGAFFSQDAKGVAILRQGMSDDNSFLRAAAVKLSSHLPDDSLQEELIRLLQAEQVWKVRLEAIHAVGELRVAKAKEPLKQIIVQELCHAEEKAAAVESLVFLCEGILPNQISHLVGSDRSGMRMLACELIVFF